MMRMDHRIGANSNGAKCTEVGPMKWARVREKKDTRSQKNQPEKGINFISVIHGVRHSKEKAHGTHMLT